MYYLESADFIAEAVPHIWHQNAEAAWLITRKGIALPETVL